MLFNQKIVSKNKKNLTDWLSTQLKTRVQILMVNKSVDLLQKELPAVFAINQKSTLPILMKPAVELIKKGEAASPFYKNILIPLLRDNPSLMEDSQLIKTLVDWLMTEKKELVNELIIPLKQLYLKKKSPIFSNMVKLIILLVEQKFEVKEIKKIFFESFKSLPILTTSLEHFNAFFSVLQKNTAKTKRMHYLYLSDKSTLLFIKKYPRFFSEVKNIDLYFSVSEICLKRMAIENNSHHELMNLILQDWEHPSGYVPWLFNNISENVSDSSSYLKDVEEYLLSFVYVFKNYPHFKNDLEILERIDQLISLASKEDLLNTKSLKPWLDLLSSADSQDKKLALEMIPFVQKRTARFKDGFYIYTFVFIPFLKEDLPVYHKVKMIDQLNKIIEQRNGLFILEKVLFNLIKVFPEFIHSENFSNHVDDVLALSDTISAESSVLSIESKKMISDHFEIKTLEKLKNPPYVTVERLKIIYSPVREFGADYYDFYELILKPILQEDGLQKKTNTQIKNRIDQIFAPAQKFDKTARLDYLAFLTKLYKDIIEERSSNQKYLLLIGMINMIFQKTSFSNRAGITQLIYKMPDYLDLEEFQKYLNLFVILSETRPRLMYPIFLEITNALRSEQLSRDLTSSLKEDILRFINKMNSFDYDLFVDFMKYGEDLLKVYDEFNKKLITDEIGPSDLEKISRSSLISRIQMTIPFSGSSFVSKESLTNHFDQFITIGDLREHIPAYWNGFTYQQNLGVERFEPLPGVAIDEKGYIRSLVDHFKTKKTSNALEIQSKLEILFTSAKYSIDHLNEGPEFEDLLPVLIAYAKENEMNGMDVSRLEGDFYTALSGLEEFFSEADLLPKTLKNELRTFIEAKRALGKIEKKTFIDDIPKFVAFLNKTLLKISNPALRAATANKILEKYSQDTIKMISFNEKLSPELKTILKNVRRPKVYYSVEELADLIFKKVLKKICGEKSKYQKISDTSIKKIETRIVKGIPFGFWGINAGVCIARDYGLWQKPEFKLMSIYDHSEKIVGGFVHIFETTMNDQRILTIPGIEPSVEYINNVNATELYELIEKSLMAFAKTGGYQEIYIPVDKIIHSNRQDIRAAIEKKKYPVIELPKPISWVSNGGYQFKKVFVVKVKKN
jgi:hypothetical protein